MDDQDSEKKSEIWLKYCEACVQSQIENADRSQSETCCLPNKKDSMNS